MYAALFSCVRVTRGACHQSSRNEISVNEDTK